MQNYCTVCDWAACIDECLQTEQGHAAINHFLATGHQIELDEEREHSTDSDYRIQETLR